MGAAALAILTAGASAAEPVRKLREKQVTRTRDLGITRPAGIAYAARFDRFIVLPAGPGAGSPAAGSAITMDRFHELMGTVAVPASHWNARAVAYDANGDRLLVLDVPGRSILAIPGDATGGFDATAAVRLEAPRVGPLKPFGMTVDARGDVYVLDRLMRRIVRFTPASGAAVPEATTIDLGDLAVRDLSGLAFDPRSGHLFTLDLAAKTAHELDAAGTAVASFDLSNIGLSDPQAMVFAPSADQTDDPASLSLFVADPGAATSTGGRVVEMSFAPDASLEALPPTPMVNATLVRVTRTSQYSPPSPDPSGVGYDPITGRLIISDAEVDEMNIYAGKNIFETNLTGQLQRSWTTVSWDREPTGTAPNRNNRHLFITNDDADLCWDVNPGNDNLWGTNDDTRTSFKTSTFGCGDPEGVAYDPVGNRIFIADGVGEEIWVIRPGPNGVFQGSGDDIITHFDTHGFGSIDPETVEWKPDTGTLLVMGSTGSEIVKEVSVTGQLLSQTDVSFAPLSKPAGLAYAPSSGGSGWSYYIVTRGVDNDSNPNENDGTLVEISVGGTAPPPNTAPVVSAGPDRTITLPAQASLDGTVTDDGLPSPPSLTTTWSKVSGPGTVTFVNANAIDTQASFSLAGTYVLRLTASDGQLSNSDQMQVTAQPSSGGNTAPVVSAGPDRTITLPAQASLDGTVTDDGLPSPPSLTTTWSKVSGPGTVTFVNANAIDTQASFSLAGTYVLQLQASDGQLSGSDVMQVTAQPTGGGGTGTDFRIAAGPDDVEESATGSLATNSTDLELVFDGSNQLVGLRFTNVTIPQGATIASAYVQFQADEAQSEVTNLVIQGEAANNAAAFSSSALVSTRARTAASVAWAPAPWNTGEAGPNQRTSDLRPVIQEIVNRNQWASGNALVLIFTGTGHRTAEAFEGLATAAPLLHIETGGTPPSNTAPVVSAGPDQTITLPAQVSLDGTVTDDGLPSPPSLTTTWSKVSGPGTVTFVNANAVDTQASFSQSGTYVLRLLANDGQLSNNDQVQVTVQPASANTAPVVSAGPDRTITLPAQAVLDGTVTDDGQPSPPSLTTTWSKVSGPGTVTFVNADAIDTQASFSLAGTYVLQLQASDGQLSSTDVMQVIAQPAGGGGTSADFRIAAGPDDVEESATGSLYTNSTDLELVFDAANQLVGLRFTNVTIPQGATIASAYVQFQADEVQSEVTNLVIQGEAANNAAPFTSTAKVSTRTRTSASSAWSPAPWNTVNEIGPAQRTGELNAVIQEIVNRGGWASGSSLVLIITGTGHRTARAFESAPTGAALLHVELAAGAASSIPGPEPRSE